MRCPTTISVLSTTTKYMKESPVMNEQNANVYKGTFHLDNHHRLSNYKMLVFYLLAANFLNHVSIHPALFTCQPLVYPVQT